MDNLTSINFQGTGTFDNFNSNNNIYPQYFSSSLKSSPSKDTFEKKEKEKKEQPSPNNWAKAGVLANCAIGLGFIGTAGAAIYQIRKGKASNVVEKVEQAASHAADDAANSAENLISKPQIAVEDLSNVRSIDQMALSDPLKKAVGDIEKQAKFGNEIRISSQSDNLSNNVLFYGIPGTGKTTIAKAIAKKMDAHFIQIKPSAIKSEYHGVTERNLNIVADSICSLAEEIEQKYLQELVNKGIISEQLAKSGNKSKIQNAIIQARQQGKKIPEKQQIVVFMDEIDSFIMKDSGSSGSHSQKISNEFKTIFTDKFGKHDNITVIGATNRKLGEIDDAIISRFEGHTIEIPKPSAEQLLDAMKKKFKNNPFIDGSLLHDDKGLDTFATNLFNETSQEVSFRTLDSIFKQAGTDIAGTSDKITLQRLEEAWNTIKRN